MKAQSFIYMIVFSLLLTACSVTSIEQATQTPVDPTTDACKIPPEASRTLTPSPSKGDMISARATLVAFFDALNGGWYEEAAVQYGGSYEELSDLNPEVDPQNHAALLKLACTINGFQCLRIKQVVQQTQTFPNTYTFTVEFINPDGSLFELKTCCEVGNTDAKNVSRFDITVMRVPQMQNAYLVQRLPVYIP